MPPALPAPPDRFATLRRIAALSLFLGLAAAAPAAALEVAVSSPRERSGLIFVDARLGDLFPPRIAESLARGMPATLRVQAELWRRRAAWFDKMEKSEDAVVRIRYDVWSDRYRIERYGMPVFEVSSIDSVATVLSRPWALPVGRVGQLQARSRYYVSVEATLKPLTVEDLAEVEGWLSGEVRSQRRAGFGVITEIPRALFDAVRNVAGFGDQRARTATADFRLRDLFPDAE